MIKALEVKRFKPLQKNLDCSSVFQEVESGRWLRVEDVDLAMPHPGTWTEDAIQCRHRSQFNILGTLSTLGVRRRWSTCPAS